MPVCVDGGWLPVDIRRTLREGWGTYTWSLTTYDPLGISESIHYDLLREFIPMDESVTHKFGKCAKSPSKEGSALYMLRIMESVMSGVEVEV